MTGIGDINNVGKIKLWNDIEYWEEFYFLAITILIFL